MSDYLRITCSVKTCEPFLILLLPLFRNTVFSILYLFFCLYIESLHLTTSTLLATRSIHVQNWRLNRSCLQWHRFYVLIEVLSATCQFFYSGKRLKFPLERFFVLSPRWPYLMSIHDIAFWYPSDHIFTEIHISFRQWYYHLQYNKWFTTPSVSFILASGHNSNNTCPKIIAQIQFI